MRSSQTMTTFWVLPLAMVDNSFEGNLADFGEVYEPRLAILTTYKSVPSSFRPVVATITILNLKS
jgi:hypothetical protein